MAPEVDSWKDPSAYERKKRWQKRNRLAKTISKEMVRFFLDIREDLPKEKEDLFFKRLNEDEIQYVEELVKELMEEGLIE